MGNNPLAREKETLRLLQPTEIFLKEMALELAEYQVCVDVFITAQKYVDIASISIIPRTTGGQIYYYYPFSALLDSAKLFNDLRWNITRPQGFEAVMRVRCSQGIDVQEYLGNFCRHLPTDIDLPGIDCDKAFMVTLKHDDKIQEGSKCAFQSAILYTTISGRRILRVSTLSLPCTNVLRDLFLSADLDVQFTCFLKEAANEISARPLLQVRDRITSRCIDILHSYRKFCAMASLSSCLIFPESLKILPLYCLALLKSTGLRTDGRIDDRSYWISRVCSLSVQLSVPLVYPRMMAVNTLVSEEADGSLATPTIPLSSEHLTQDGVFLLENGEDALIFIGSQVNSDILQQLVGSDDIPHQFLLQQYDNPLSKKLNDMVNGIRCLRSSYLRLRLCREGETSGMQFSSYMVEDKGPGTVSYVEFLHHIKNEIQVKLSRGMA